jgi:hypothetical protein
MTLLSIAVRSFGVTNTIIEGESVRTIFQLELLRLESLCSLDGRTNPSKTKGEQEWHTIKWANMLEQPQFERISTF